MMITSGYAMVVHGRPKTPKNTSFWGSPSPQGSYSPYILRNTTRPGHVTCILVWSKSDQRQLRKTLHKQTDTQTNKQTNRHYENNGHLAVNQLIRRIQWRIVKATSDETRSVGFVYYYASATKKKRSKGRYALGALPVNTVRTYGP